MEKQRYLIASKILSLFIDLRGIIQTRSRLDIIMGNDPKNFEAVSKNINVQYLNIISDSMPLYAKNTKNKSISFASIFAKNPLGKNYRKGQIQGAKIHRLRYLHRAFLLTLFLIPERISSALKHRCLLKP